MKCPILLPDPELVQLESVFPEADCVVFVVSARRSAVPCPLCHRPAQSVHSHYRRTIADQPWGPIRVRIELGTRRWFCHHADCARGIFTERFPGFVQRSARRTEGQARVLRLIAYMLGGEAGARTADELGMPVSPDTLLRQLRGRSQYKGPSPPLLGVDDFALARGQRYGTILVNLETGEPIDLLPDRTAENFAAWLQAHPGAKVISRDRGGSYADGARRGAPEAVQVADRFHLIQNLVAALTETLGDYRDSIHAAGDLPRNPPGRSRADQARSAASRAQRQARYAEVRNLSEQSLPVETIASQVGVSPDTVRRWLAAPGFPERKDHPRRPNPVAPYAAYLQQRWAEGCQNCRKLWEELCAQGFTGKPYQVWEFTKSWPRQRSARRAAKTAKPRTPRSSKAPAPENVAASAPPTPEAGTPGGEPTPAREAAPPAAPSTVGEQFVETPAPRTLAWWLLRPEKCTAAQTVFVERLQALSTPIRLSRELVEDFLRLSRERKGDELAGWVERVEASGQARLIKFAHGLRADWDAVVAGLILPWSNGVVEGNINRLKLLKRQMYGRAKLELLCSRVLPRAVRSEPAV